jgi:hypothetical protein
MPAWHIAIQEALNEVLSARNISDLQRHDWASGRPADAVDGLLDAIDEYLDDAKLSGDERAYVQSLPEAVRAALGGAIQSGIARGVPVQVAWRPAYYPDVQVWDVAGVELGSGTETPTAITIVISTRLPNDPLPDGS